MRKKNFLKKLPAPALAVIVLLDIILLCKDGFDWLVVISLAVAAAVMIAGFISKDSDPDGR